MGLPIQKGPVAGLASYKLELVGKRKSHERRAVFQLVECIPPAGVGGNRVSSYRIIPTAQVKDAVPTVSIKVNSNSHYGDVGWAVAVPIPVVQYTAESATSNILVFRVSKCSHHRTGEMRARLALDMWKKFGATLQDKTFMDIVTAPLQQKNSQQNPT